MEIIHEYKSGFGIIKMYGCYEDRMIPPKKYIVSLNGEPAKSFDHNDFLDAIDYMEKLKMIGF
jgi:hypothetical protein